MDNPAIRAEDTRRYSEGLALELKSWLDPSRLEHRAVIVRTLIALRNHGGGSLFIGFKDDGSPRPDAAGFDVRTTYHPDLVQELVSRHASNRFTVTTEIVETSGIDYVRIDVEAGVRTPVRVTTSITGDRDGRPFTHLAEGSVPVRTLQANGRPSTAECGNEDWERLMQICFDNREADIGRFLRRHLPSSAETIAGFIEAIHDAAPPKASERVSSLLDLGRGQFVQAMSRLPSTETALLESWGGREAGMIITPAPTGFGATADFLRRMISSVPRHTSYPPWLDTSVFGASPEVRNSQWQGTLLHTERFDALTFEIFDPKGEFYERRLVLPDVIARHNKAKPKVILGERQTIADVAEVLLTGIAFAAAMNVGDEHHTLNFGFRWSGLRDRLIDDWFIGTRNQHVAVEEQSRVIQVSFPADTPGASLAPIIADALSPLFEMFRGYATSATQIDDTLRRVLDRTTPY